MLALKIVLVPSFLLLVSVAGRSWGPSVAGLLAGLPVVAGPVLYLFALEHGPAFASKAAFVSLGGVLTLVVFGAAYAHASRRWSWPASLVLALSAWAASALLLSCLPIHPLLSLCVAVATLASAPCFFPREPLPRRTSSGDGSAELLLRMLAGAGLTLLVTSIAGAVGQEWSGLLAVFPILSIVLSVFSHRAQGAEHARAVLGSMARGLVSFTAFCFVLGYTLTHLGVPQAFGLAICAALAAQAAALMPPLMDRGFVRK
jgi:uncharacterized membrane protein (GlpM family)